MGTIWLWQTVVTPHMGGLASELSESGVKVVYVAPQLMSEARVAQGWQPPSLGNAKLQIIPAYRDALSFAEKAPPEVVHICQGIRGNGHITQVQRRLAQLGRKQWVVMESVDDSGWRGILKRLAYRVLFRRLGPSLQGVLATGRGTAQWVIDRGVPGNKVYPFAYFLPGQVEPVASHQSHSRSADKFRLLFVGQFIERKRLDLLIGALAEIDRMDVELVVVGSGPMEGELHTLAQRQLGQRVQWVGRLHMAEVHELMTEVDCLVLPSRYDGWGAVVVEALMAGTPAICSDHCGSAEAVVASGMGGVFRSGDRQSLLEQLNKVIDEGKRTDVQREELASWATCFSAQAGAGYLVDILVHASGAIERPTPPWLFA